MPSSGVPFLIGRITRRVGKIALAVHVGNADHDGFRQALYPGKCIKLHQAHNVNKILVGRAIQQINNGVAGCIAGLVAFRQVNFSVRVSANTLEGSCSTLPSTNGLLVSPAAGGRDCPRASAVQKVSSIPANAFLRVGMFGK